MAIRSHEVIGRYRRERFNAEVHIGEKAIKTIKALFVATRLAWESLCTRAYVMHAHYDL